MILLLIVGAPTIFFLITDAVIYHLVWAHLRRPPEPPMLYRACRWVYRKLKGLM